MKNTIIRDNVHGDISIIDEVAYELINAPEFQRLKRISQMGGAQHVFIGAAHTRFAHCLGVYHLICKFFENPSITNVEPFNDEKNRLTVKIAGLLHDIGHGPFSHSFEKVGHNSKKHEYYSGKIIMSPSTEINRILTKFNLDTNEIASIIDGKHKNNLMNLLVSSQLDADRLDYLLRDSYNSGVSYSKVDVDWIIRNSKIFENKMVFPLKTVYAIESYLLGRYYMYNQVYCHKTSFAFDVTLKKWFLRFTDLYNEDYKFKNSLDYDLLYKLASGKEYSVDDYLELDDPTFISLIKKTISEDDEVLSDLASRVINRQFLEPLEIIKEKVEEKKELVISKGYNINYYFAIENFHEVQIYAKNKDGKDESIFIQGKDGEVNEITKFSRILGLPLEQKNKNIIFIPKI